MKNPDAVRRAIHFALLPVCLVCFIGWSATSISTSGQDKNKKVSPPKKPETKTVVIAGDSTALDTDHITVTTNSVNGDAPDPQYVNVPLAPKGCKRNPLRHHGATKKDG